ncbi:putative oxidoreductase YdhV [Pelotomaculum schinkii]|uniref:Putative oxidoreductase YdhV n=1 Tax=Pelotomaculum schinkii TaxID=78350 RepID=A0A4Y7R6C5_9FIRM|nr:aldehyde ferredoxin oxidoreductase family protein [Pelotomaculum schinkii]TEB04518.1 putative oxidoreductase YdhV [Pelotomaculum schinkii]
MIKLIKIDLTDKKVSIEDTTELQRDFLGGLGVNTKLLVELTPPGADPLGPDNNLIFGAGTFVGTLLPTAARTELTAKSPLSNRFGTSNSGGLWGAALKFAGYSHIVLTGKSPTPVYITIDNDQIKIEDATHLWGLNTCATMDWIRRERGKDYQVASIGPAGEKLVRFASVQNNYHGAWGRTGMGAVMGSKNLKAIAVRGNGKVKVADRRSFARIMTEAFKKVINHESFGYTHRYGSMVVADPYNKIGALPGYNFTRGYFEDWVDTRGRGVFERKYKEKDLACFSCPVACAHWTKVKNGIYKGYGNKGLEVSFVLEFGAKLGIKEIAEILKCAEVCNLYGMDVVSASGVIAFAIEANQNGLLGNLSMEVPSVWGDFLGILKLLENIGQRKGIGDLLAEGIKRASENIPGSKQFAMHIKGVEIPVRDPRAKWDVWTLGYLTNTRGGDSLRTRSPVDNLYGKERNYFEEETAVSEDTINKLDMPNFLKKEIFGEPPFKVDIPKMARYSEDLITIINSTGLCIRPPVHRALGTDFYARALTAVTGHPYTEQDVMKIAAIIWDLQHQFNVLAGEKLEDFAFPDRFYEESLTIQSGTKAQLPRDIINEVVHRYFKARKWDYAEEDLYL